MTDSKVWKFTPFGCRDDIFERYNKDPHFRALTDQMEWILKAGYSTPTELREAMILAATRVEFATLRREILDPFAFDIEDGVMDSIKRKIKNQEPSE